MKIDLEYVEKIAKIITDNSLSEITLSQGDDMITVRKDTIVNIPQEKVFTPQETVKQPVIEPASRSATFPNEIRNSLTRRESSSLRVFLSL